MRFFRICLFLVVSTFGLLAAEAPVYVPVGTWVYPALQRLASLGYIKDQPSDMGPWTRSECRRQVEEAAAAVGDRSELATSLLRDLQAEFSEEAPGNTELRLESLYMRAGGIGGQPLNDSYHFGQTVVNDFGRPFGEGFNAVAGFSAYARHGRFSAYMRGEYQQAPGHADYGAVADNWISRMDANPVQGSAAGSTRRFEPLEMYAGAQVWFENITFGKQALWWGPGAESAFAFSNNAAPFYMARFQQARPLRLGRFAELRTEFLFGQLSGHHWPAHPYMNAQKVSIELPIGLELGFTRSALFGGEGRPLTLASFRNSLVSTYSPFTGADPGDRHSGFDFRWHVPGLRRWVTVYSDSYADDDPNPLDNPKRSAWAPGIYINQMPGLRRLDLRAETYSTWLYRKDQGPQFLYYNNAYHDSYTNQGSLLGSWIGRDSRAYVGTVGYSWSAKTRLEGKYRQTKVANGMLPGGGTQTDFGLTGTWAPRAEWILGAQLQGERYWLPVLGPARKDMVASVQITYTPGNWKWVR